MSKEQQALEGALRECSFRIAHDESVEPGDVGELLDALASRGYILTFDPEKADPAEAFAPSPEEVAAFDGALSQFDEALVTPTDAAGKRMSFGGPNALAES